MQGIHKKEVGEELGVNGMYVSALERGIRTPGLENFIKRCNIPNVSADVLLEDVLDHSYTVKSSVLTDKVMKLSEKEQNRVFRVVEAMITEA